LEIPWTLFREFGFDNSLQQTGKNYVLEAKNEKTKKAKELEEKRQEIENGKLAETEKQNSQSHIPVVQEPEPPPPVPSPDPKSRARMYRYTINHLLHSQGSTPEPSPMENEKYRMTGIFSPPKKEELDKPPILETRNPSPLPAPVPTVQFPVKEDIVSPRKSSPRKSSPRSNSRKFGPTLQNSNSFKEKLEQQKQPQQQPQQQPPINLPKSGFKGNNFSKLQNFWAQATSRNSPKPLSRNEAPPKVMPRPDQRSISMSNPTTGKLEVET